MSIQFSQQPRPEPQELALVKAPKGPVLFHGRGSQFEEALSYLSSCHQPTLARLTGGCLDISQERAKEIEAVLRGGLGIPQQQFRGIFLNGGTYSENKSPSGDLRPSIPEIGARLSFECSEARCMGIVPGSEFDEELLKVTDDGEWQVRIHEDQSRILVSERTTPYLWDAEWQKVMELRETLIQRGAVTRSILISYDGGRATENELRAWADLSNSEKDTHVILLRGGDPYRATDSLARKIDWISQHPNVHACPLSALALHSLLSSLDCFGEAASSRMQLKTA